MHVPHILAAATIRGRRLFHSELLILRLLFKEIRYFQSIALCPGSSPAVVTDYIVKIKNWKRPKYHQKTGEESGNEMTQILEAVFLFCLEPYVQMQIEWLDLLKLP